MSKERERDGTMRDILRSNDLVELSWAQAVLRDAGIEAVMLDSHTSVLEGSLGILPRRLVVLDEDFAAALGLLEAARATVEE